MIVGWGWLGCAEKQCPRESLGKPVGRSSRFIAYCAELKSAIVAYTLSYYALQTEHDRVK
jgi:hypothetical protein